jgi:uncharacterized membrane protein YbhN (UPF0104 family)
MDERRQVGIGYALALCAGFAALLALGLLGLPVRTAILLALAALPVLALLYALGVIAAGRRRALARRRRRTGRVSSARAAARLRSPA